MLQARKVGSGRRLPFNGRFRAECLNTHWFLTIADAREKLEEWRRYLYVGGPRQAVFSSPSPS